LGEDEAGVKIGGMPRERGDWRRGERPGGSTAVVYIYGYGIGRDAGRDIGALAGHGGD